MESNCLTSPEEETHRLRTQIVGHSASRRRAPAFTRANDTEHDTFTHEFQARRSRETRSGYPSRARYSGRSLHSPDGRTPAKGRGMLPLSVTPALAPREADDTAICARKSLAEPSGYGHRSAASPPAARDGRGRLRRDGPRARLGFCSGRSSSSRLHLRWRRASLVVLALLALVVAPGTTFVTATESGKGPRGRRLAQANPVPDLHLVADDITDVNASNLVQSWSDHTGNGLSLSSFVAAPELVDGGNISTGALFNGHKAVRFGESGITGLSLPTSALQLSTSLEGMTVVAVMSTDDSRDAIFPFVFDRGVVAPEGFGFQISPARVKVYSAEGHGGKSTTNYAPPIESGKMYVVTTQWKFAKSGVSGHQLATTQHGDLSNPDLLPVTCLLYTSPSPRD